MSSSYHPHHHCCHRHPHFYICSDPTLSQKHSEYLSPPQNLGSPVSFLRDPSAPSCPSPFLRVSHFHTSSSSPSPHGPHSGAGSRPLGSPLHCSQPLPGLLVCTLFQTPLCLGFVPLLRGWLGQKEPGEENGKHGGWGGGGGGRGERACGMK